MTTIEKIQSFVDAGKDKLANYEYASEELNKKRLKLLPDEDSEAGVYFRLNQTGNIFYATTSEVIKDETKKLFDSVTFLFAAMNKAVSDKDKDLFDYEVWGKVMRGSGYFIEVAKFEKSLTIKERELTMDTQIIQGLIPGLKTGASLDIAKSVLSAISGTYGSGGSHEKSRFAHLLFICEELFGAPSVTVRLFFGSTETHTDITSTPCSTYTSKTIKQKQEADTFLFVQSVYDRHSKTYEELVEDMKKLI